MFPIGLILQNTSMDIAQYHVACTCTVKFVCLFLLRASALEVIVDVTGDTKKLCTFCVYPTACVTVGYLSL